MKDSIDLTKGICLHKSKSNASLKSASTDQPRRLCFNSKDFAFNESKPQAFTSRPPIPKPFAKLPLILQTAKRFNLLSKPSQNLIQEASQLLNSLKTHPLPHPNPVTLQKPFGYEKKKTLVLDLDETLVHAEADTKKSHISVKIGKNHVVGLNIRPFAFDLLKFAAKEFEVIVFTASSRQYADAIINHLDPQRLYIHHRLYRESCVEYQGNYIKDLRILGNRSMKDIIIVDNCISSFIMQVDNGVPISSWTSNLSDIQIRILIDYLRVALSLNDMRVLNKQIYQLTHDLCN